jgi:hypothetical protein
MSDAASPRARNGKPRLIPGIYNYCDGRCARCKFSARCITYLVETRLERAGPNADEEAIFEEVMGPRPEPPPEFSELIAEANARVSSMTPEEHATFDRQQEEHARAIADDRLVTAARGYSMSAWNITQALEGIVERRGDPIVIEAVESIGELAGPIGSKVTRAVCSSIDAVDLDDDGFALDANGSAKVARLAIEESRGAWRVLSEGDRGTADGVPAAMLRMLDEIDAQLAQRFPDAMAFVRPGFDTEDPP